MPPSYWRMLTVHAGAHDCGVCGAKKCSLLFMQFDRRSKPVFPNVWPSLQSCLSFVNGAVIDTSAAAAMPLLARCVSRPCFILSLLSAPAFTCRLFADSGASRVFQVRWLLVHCGSRLLNPGVIDSVKSSPAGSSLAVRAIALDSMSQSICTCAFVVQPLFNLDGHMQHLSVKRAHVQKKSSRSNGGLGTLLTVTITMAVLQLCRRTQPWQQVQRGIRS